jgi:hypothetical protein
MDIQTHTYIHACIHAYIHAYIHTYILTHVLMSKQTAVISVYNIKILVSIMKCVYCAVRAESLIVTQVNLTL